jgi:hypothetical protein
MNERELCLRAQSGPLLGWAPILALCPAFPSFYRLGETETRLEGRRVILM